ncbi:MAG: AAA family ATPase [Pasteurella sp.]|nr:AAA family ATPase [Pasteurella sp.]
MTQANNVKQFSSNKVFSDFSQLLKKVKLKDSPRNKFISKKNLITALQLVEVKQEIKSKLVTIFNLDEFPPSFGNRKAKEYLDFQAKDKPVLFDDEIKIMLNEALPYLREEYIYIPNYEKISNKDFFRKTLKDISSALTNLPYYRKDMDSLATSLALQLSTSDNIPPRLMLHHSFYSNTAELITALCNIFEKKRYKYLVIDCERYDGQSEQFVFCGSPSVWSGSRPGLITQFIYKNPNALIILKNLEKANPAITRCLTSALEHGTMVDEFGLKDNESYSSSKTREPTEINCSSSIFIALTSQSAELYEQKHFLTLLQNHPQNANHLVYRDMKAAKRKIRQNTVNVFDTGFLNNFQNNLILLQPQPWNMRIKFSANRLSDYFKDIANYWGLPKINISLSDAKTLTKIMLLNAQTMNNDEKYWAEYLLSPIIDKLLITGSGDEAAEEIYITVSENAEKKLYSYIKELGHEQIQATQTKRSQSLDIIFKTFGNKVIVQDVKPNTIVQVDNNELSLSISFPKYSLQDIIGQEQPKAFLKEVIPYFSKASQIMSYGVSLPKGIMLLGRPGTGKSFIAKCFAGEAKIPFISVSGSDLLYPKKSDELKNLIKHHSPCLVFIDEADALGSRLDSEANATAINKLLPYIDGFENDDDMIAFFILATNYPERIDKALLRSGRIDKAFHVGSLLQSDRKIWFNNLKPFLNDDINSDCKSLLLQTHDYTSAQMQQLKQEIILTYLKQDKKVLNKEQVEQIIYKIHWGDYTVIEQDNDRNRTIAVHEIGHALSHYLLFKENHEINCISIRPSARIENSGGFTGIIQTKELILKKSTIEKKLITLLGGRAAEIVCFGKENVSAGSSSDLDKASNIVWHGIVEAGLDEDVGLFTLKHTDIELQNKQVNACQKWLIQAENQAIELLSENKELILFLANHLQKKEVISGNLFKKLINNFKNNKEEIENA